MKAKEIREKTAEDLVSLEGDLRKKLFRARFDNHANSLDDTSSIQKSRRDLARVLTVKSERARAEKAVKA